MTSDGERQLVNRKALEFASKVGAGVGQAPPAALRECWHAAALEKRELEEEQQWG